jgi:hypothetical protein
MKKIMLLSVIMVAFAWGACAQEINNDRSARMSSTFLKDPGYGSRINFGVTFAPTISWMYPHTEGYERNGANMGMRYGFNLNVNLTQRKNFYFSTGIFAEHSGGKMKFLDIIPIWSLDILADSIPTQRTYRSIYLTIPTMITMKTNSINNFYICGNAGLMHSFKLYSSNTDSYLFGTELWSREKQVSEETALFKESFILGVGFEYSVTPAMRAGVMVNYVQSFTNYFKGKGLAQNSLSKLDQRANIGCVEIALNINFF